MTKSIFISLRIILAPVICLTLIFTHSNLNAQGISYNEEFQVNTYVDSNQEEQNIASLKDGGFVICWSSVLQDGSLSGVYCQIFNNNGSFRSSELQVNTTILKGQSQPSICSLNNGGFAVCWQSDDQDGSDSGIYGQIFYNDGTRLGSEFQVNTYITNDQQRPSISNFPNGGFVITWQSDGQDGSGNGVYGQRFSNDGSLIGPEFQVNSFNIGFQGYPSVSSYSNDNYVICWSSNWQDSSNMGIYAQLYNYDGSKIGKEFQVNTHYKDDQTHSRVNNLSDGGFVICWQSKAQDGNDDGIFAQIFNSNGSRRGSEFKVNSYTIGGQTYPSVFSANDDEFVICWLSNSPEINKNGVFGQIYKNDGTKKGIEFKIDNFNKFKKFNPKGCDLQDRGFVVSWQSLGQDGSGWGIIGKYYLKNEIIHELTPFSLLKPAIDATIQVLEIPITWQKPSSMHINFPWELEYNLYMDKNEDFTNPTILSDIYDTTYTITLDPGETYFWKVLAKNLAGDRLWSSNTGHFYIQSIDLWKTIIDMSGDNYWIYDYTENNTKLGVVKCEIVSISAINSKIQSELKSTFYFANDTIVRRMNWTSDSSHFYISGYRTLDYDATLYDASATTDSSWSISAYDGFLYGYVDLKLKQFIFNGQTYEGQEITTSWRYGMDSGSGANIFKTIPYFGPLYKYFKGGSKEYTWMLANCSLEDTIYGQPHWPVGLSANYASDSLFVLWFANIDENISGYKIYGGFNPDPDTLLGFSPNPRYSMPYPDFGYQSKYYLNISAVNQKGIEGRKKEIVIPNRDLNEFYVSPNGDDTNWGGAWDNSLKTITAALNKLPATNENPVTIYLAKGHYSPQLTGETIPIIPKSNVTFIGAGRDETIIDGDAKGSVFKLSDLNNIKIEGLSITNGKGTLLPSGYEQLYFGGGIYCKNSDIILKNISLNDNVKPFYGGGMYCDNCTIMLENVLVCDNVAFLMGGGLYFIDTDPQLKNVTVKYNQAAKSLGNSILDGGGGIVFHNSTPVFDPENRCSIFLNDAPTGSDLYAYNHVTVILDTFSILQPTEKEAYPLENFTFDIHHYHEKLLALKNLNLAFKEISLKLEWQQSPNPNCVGYNIYGDVTPSSENILFTTNNVSETKKEFSYQSLLNSFQIDSVFYFSVTAFDMNGFESNRAHVSFILDDISPMQIENVTITTYTGSNITLKWSKSASPATAGYNIYGDIIPGSGNIIYTTTETSNTTTEISYKYLMDNFQIDSLFYFSVTCYNLFGFESPRTNISISLEEIFPDKFKLHQNYPNPFNPGTTIKISLPKARKVRIELFSTSGKRVTTITNKEYEAGTHTIEFTAGNLATGVYYYRMLTGGYSDVKKMVIIK